MKATVRDLGIDVLKALKIDTTHVRGFELRCFVGEAATIRIERLIDAEFDVSDLDAAFISTQLGKVIKSELIEIEPKEWVTAGQEHCSEEI